MAKVFALSILMLYYCSMFLAANCKNFTNCDSDITVLESALYSPENIKQLNRIFYPPRETTSRFITVKYEFEGTDCNVTYIWAIGGFLLMQPPKIFQLTSLYFSTPANELTDLLIKLPNECWPLVYSNGDNCTCLHDDNILDILTQQLGVYAKFNTPERVIRDSTLHVQAICDEELKSDYYSKTNTRLFMACTAIIPLFFIATLSIFARSYHREINSELARERNHGNVAALAILGIFTQWVIMGMNIAAVYYVYSKQYEYKKYQLQHTVNLFITIVLLVFDSVVGLVQLVCLIYLWCALCHQDSAKNCPYHGPLRCTNLCLESQCPYCLIPCFYAIFGNKIQKIGWKMPGSYAETGADKTTNQRISWIMLNMLISPLFSIASHSGYILISWLTQPSSTTSTALITLAVLMYTFLVTRQCYMAHSGLNLKRTCWSVCILLYPFYQCATHFCNPIMLCNHYRKYKTDEVEGDDDELKELLEPKNVKGPNKSFNLQAFCITIGWGILIAGSLTFTIIAFYEIPFKTLDLVTYLLNIFQIFIVVIALLITYKVFMLSEPEFQRFFRNVRKTYRATQTAPRQPNNHIEEVDDDTVDDVEASGVITAKMFDVIIHKL